MSKNHVPNVWIWDGLCTVCNASEWTKDIRICSAAVLHFQFLIRILTKKRKHHSRKKDELVHLFDNIKGNHSSKKMTYVIIFKKIQTFCCETNHIAEGLFFIFCNIVPASINFPTLLQKNSKGKKSSFLCGRCYILLPSCVLRLSASVLLTARKTAALWPTRMTLLLARVTAV